MYMRYTMIDWSNSTGPITGIADRPGIGRFGSRGGLFSSDEFLASTSLYKKLVRPSTRTLMTTPTITWST